MNGIGYAWSLVVWCRVISSHRSLPLHCRLGSVRSLTTFLSLTSPYSERRGGYGEGRDADVRGEQTQGYEAKRVRGMKGVSHSRYVHSTCLSSL